MRRPKSIASGSSRSAATVTPPSPWSRFWTWLEQRSWARGPPAPPAPSIPPIHDPKERDFLVSEARQSLAAAQELHRHLIERAGSLVFGVSASMSIPALLFVSSLRDFQLRCPPASWLPTEIALGVGIGLTAAASIMVGLLAWGFRISYPTPSFTTLYGASSTPRSELPDRWLAKLHEDTYLVNYFNDRIQSRLRKSYLSAALYSLLSVVSVGWFIGLHILEVAHPC